MTRVGLSSYHRMKRRAEIAEFEEARLGQRLAECLDTIHDLREHNNALVRRANGQASLAQDLWTVVGGVLLAAGLIAAIVWGVFL